MDFFDNENWWLTKLLLSTFGAWPFQLLPFRIFFSSLIGFLLESIFIPEIIKIYLSRGDTALVLECLPVFTFHLVINIIMYCYLSQMSEVKALLLHIKSDWYSNKLFSDELEILKDGAKENRKQVHWYAGIMYVIGFILMLMPLMPKILDAIAPLDKPRTGVVFYYTEFFVDQDEHKHFFVAHGCLISMIPTTLLIAFDAFFANCIQHACSMLTIFGNRLLHLEEIIDGSTEEDFNNNLLDKSIADCVRLHNSTLKFVRLLEKIYSYALFVILGIQTVLLSITGYEVVGRMKQDASLSFVRLTSYMTGQIFHIFFFCFFGQKLMNSSDYINYLIYEGKWYKLPQRTQKVLCFIMMRCYKPCTISAGYLFLVSYEIFSNIMRTAMSYFTVLASVQES